MAGCGAALTGVGGGAVEVRGAHFFLVAFVSNCGCGQSCSWAMEGWATLLCMYFVCNAIYNMA